jgi:KipI family sensor histidine kinase inhibitor
VTIRILNYGDRALLIECGCPGHVLALATAIREERLPGVVDIVPGAETVLVSVSGPRHQATVRAMLGTITASHPEGEEVSGNVDVVVDVVYDGADLTEVADRLGMAVTDVIAAHTGTPWRVGFVGFAPGFAYLMGGDPKLAAVPRRSDPRPRVAAGSVALAGGFSGIYPRESPGGWQLIGRTEAVLWDVDRPHPALLTPGMLVRFRDTGTP